MIRDIVTFAATTAVSLAFLGIITIIMAKDSLTHQ
jgi:hypothetical protein|tara:strand:+ start:210 stop:314 length:105 start_codon:yes stop_codon:yes gene_type:complete